MKRILPFLLLVAAASAGVIEIKPNFVQNQVTVGYTSKEELVEQNVENPSKGGRIYLQIFRDTEAAAAPANFQIQIVDSEGKELLRTKGGDEKPDEDEDGWSSMIHINLAEPWEKELTVKVHEKGGAKLLTYVMTRKADEDKGEGGEKGEGDK